MNNITMSIPKLTGRENWSTWSFAVKAYLQHEDLHNCISAEPNPNDPKAVKDDVKAKSKLILLVDPILNINFNVDDEWLGTLMLAGLPDSYKPMIMGIESSGVKISADLIKTKLLQEVKSIDSDTTVLYTKHNNVKDPQNNPKKGPRCFICNKYGHISKNCKSKKAIQNKNKDTSYVAVFSAATKYDDGFYIDSGASMHLTMRQDWLYDEVPPPITSIKIANSKMLPVKSCGKIDLNVIGSNNVKQTIQITHVLYVPELTTNLLSVSQIMKNGCSIQFTKQGCKIFNKMNTEVAAANLINNMYRLNTDTVTAYSCKMNETDFLLWHKRMAHLNFNDLNKLSNCTDGVKLIQNKNQMVCELCQKGKQSRLPFPSEGSRALNPLELIHSDVCGPMEVKSLGGARSILKFKEYKALVENQLNFKIKCLRSDNGREYLSNDFSNYLKKSGIIHQTSNSYTPQQNGLAERMNRTLMERARCMLINSDLQKSYWAEAVSTAAYITNRCPTRALSYATPEEMWSGKKPDVSHLKIFGCEAMVKIPKEKLRKLDSKASKMIFIGYSDTTKGYKFIDPKTKKGVISRDVVFMESSLTQNHVVVPLTTDENEVNKNKHIMLSPELQENSNDSSESKVSESSSNDDSFHSNDESYQSNDDSLYIPKTKINIEHDSNIKTRSKAKKQDNNTYLCKGISETDVPQTYSEAISSPNEKKWKQSIMEELKAHENNETWTLVENPWSKDNWMQIDYTETFSPTVRYDSVRILLSEACQYDLKIVQFDVKTAFLYGDIKENIYMNPPEGIESPPNFVCKLNRSLYGLKQAPRPHTKLEKKNIVSEVKIPYKEAVGSLMHLAIVSRPDIMFGVSLVSRYLNCYDSTHWAVVKKILKYLKETKEMGILYSKVKNNTVEGYSDSDYAADSDTRRSTTGYVFTKNAAAITWATQRQQSIALSTTEAEFMAACSAAKEALWIKDYYLILVHIIKTVSV
ncbi:Retrovirus-related Pol polyprotein from transposon TNT 1-94 [Eumeta japonica]|uniref:Retrovirus-related Pol polyprotein from transposon TNT 1-94 n=1 Tax=Eumeta variegata TaxID=151549 RepID=A0A4C1UC08_EUMVA|nr:Retrovirus-related Pol polyprotein from transposon TNT 1-94 [Eumeta japonica]